jgi:choline dehydrogenase-like flavoprotein
MITERLDEATARPADVVVVGAGPIGVTTALELTRLGRRALLIESGGHGSSAAAQALSDHEVVDPATHHPAATTVARRLGGASNLWGGRLVPFDPIDFQPRPWLGLGGWPIGPEAVAPFYADACAYLDGGPAEFEDAPDGFDAPDRRFRADTLERWSHRHRVQRLHDAALRSPEGPTVLLRTVATGLVFDADGAVSGLDLRLADGASARLAARTVVLAGGGNEALRLLLAARRTTPGRFGGPDGPLGRFYMGHLNGTIADISFADARLDAAMDFYVDRHGRYVRRRFTPDPALQAAESLLNVAFWPVVHDVADPRHGSGPLSLAYLALSIGPFGRLLVAEPIRRKHVGDGPRRLRAHLANILLDLPRVATFAPRFLYGRRFADPRLPGFFLRNRNRRYGLEFHSEQSPDPDSRIVLSDRADATGLPLLRIDYRFREDDAARIVRAHDLLADWMTATGVGRLEHRHPPAERVTAALREARHGNHQIGAIRMAASPGQGVVDPDCAVFGAPGLHVASTAVLPTSGQANPTLIAAALAVRLARRLAAAH